MLFSDYSGQIDMGIPSDHYKRAVLRAPPSRFSVDFLPSSRSSGSYNYGMRISPIASGDRYTISSGTNVEFDIWRRWEDCLWFQETLELEYKRAAREKKIRLAQGKGVKSFNGMYKQDMASSWESLPPGPDPNSVAQDVHEYLPRLNKKGTVFRASQATIDQRQKEFRSLIEALFSESMPALIQEIRSSNIINDFFGLWRRDYDLMEKTPKPARNSLTGSVFSSYFSESSPSLATSPELNSRSLPGSPAKKPSSKHRDSRDRPRSTGSGGTETSDITEVSRCPSSRPSSRRLSGETTETVSTATYRTRRRALSVTSSDSSSSAHSDGSSDSGSTTSTTPAIVVDEPVVFGHNPQFTNERPSSILEVLPEEREMLAKSPGSYLDTPLRRKQRPSTPCSATERKANRSWQIVGIPTDQTHFQKDERSVREPIRESWQTTTSMDSTANDILNDLGFSLPHPIKEQKYRASIASISTFMTTDSAEAIIPRSPTTPSPTDGRKPFPSRISTALSLSDFEIYSDVDDDSTSIIDAFPRPTSYMPARPDSRPETPTGNLRLTVPNSPPSARSSSYNPPPSPTMSTVSSAYTFSTTASSASPGSLSIKAAHNTSIIMLRVPRELSFSEIRQRLYNKFVGQEGVPLSQEFSVAFVLPSAPTSPAKGRLRSASVSSADRMLLQFINSESDWADIISTLDSTKVTLRILDPAKA